jgi:DNA-directed RNA polymerase I and III subunit RPAC1
MTSPYAFSNLAWSGGRKSALAFDVDGVPICVVNSVRRAIMACIQTAAFAYDPTNPGAPSGITIKANTSTLHNEFVAHRLSLLPVHLDEDELERFLLDPSRYRFSIRVKNSAAASGAAVAVTSRDIAVTDAFGAPAPKETRDAMFPPDPITGDHALLLQLRPSTTGDGNGEEISVDMVASGGTGAAHARWSPVSQCFFRNRPDPALVEAAFQAVRQSAAAGAGAGTGGGGAPKEAELRRQFDATQAPRCFLKNAGGEPTRFTVLLESECGLRPEAIYFKALRVLAGKLRTLSARVRGAPLTPPAEASGAAAGEEPVVLTTFPNAEDFYQLVVRGEDHTLGNLAHGLLYAEHIDGGAMGKVLQFIGYHEPHPLERHIIFKFKVAPGTDAPAFMADAFESAAATVDAIARAWVEASGLAKGGEGGEGGRRGVREVDEFVREGRD